MRTSRLGYLRPRQQGAILITSMIFLVVLTLFVLAMVRSGTLEERMARNTRDHQVAMEAAESVLRNAEDTMFSGAPFDPYDSSQFTAECANGLCFRPNADNTWRTIDWESALVTRTFSSADAAIAELDQQPRYVVEIVRAPQKTSSAGQCENGLARVTARGAGNGGATVYLQSTVRFRVFTNICD